MGEIFKIPIHPHSHFIQHALSFIHVFFIFPFQFVTIEAVITVVVDLFPRLTKGCNREIFVFFYCAVSYVAGLSMVTNVSKGVVIIYGRGAGIPKIACAQNVPPPQ